MRLIGFGFTDVTNGPLQAGYTDLSDVTVLIGPNDSGKSSTLALLADALDPQPPVQLHAWFGPPPRPNLVVFVVCSEGERDLSLTSIADPTHDPARRSRAPQCPRTTTDGPTSTSGRAHGHGVEWSSASWSLRNASVRTVLGSS
jgi:hypothetical protein